MNHLISINSRRFSFKFETFPKTYFLLLPAELKVLLTSYYYGPLEMSFSLTNEKLRLEIIRYGSNNKVDALFVLTGNIDKLVKKYNNMSKAGKFYLNSGKITWDANEVEIQLGKNLDENIIFLTDYMAELFWQKLQTIIDILHEYQEQGLTTAQILDKFKLLTF